MFEAARRLRLDFNRATPTLCLAACLAIGQAAYANCSFCDTVLEGPVESFACLDAQLEQLIAEARQQTPIIVRLSCELPDATVDFKNRLEIVPQEGGTGVPSPAYILDLWQLECLANTLPAQLDTNAGKSLRIDLTECTT